MLNESKISSFKASLRGEVIAPGDARYDEARAVYNAMTSRRPRLIARCADVADVIASVNFAREQKLSLSIRGGGRDATGLDGCDDGLVIDLSPMRYVRVDPKARTVRVGGGARWGDVDHAAHAFGLAVPTGIVSTKGVGGSTIDNLLEADLVLADGRVVTASATDSSDLFWGIRGGGNVGVMTSSLYKAHPIDTDYAGA